MKLVELTKGHSAIVDDEDYEWLSGFKWCYDNGYAVRKVKINGRQKKLLMHRVIINAPDGIDVDHDNLNRLDNRRFNLKLRTRSETMHHQPAPRTNTSGYKGVYLRRESGQWRAEIRVHGNKLKLGTFDTAIEAARAYDEAAREHFGASAKVNGA